MNLGEGSSGAQKRSRGYLFVGSAVVFSLWTLLRIGGNTEWLEGSRGRVDQRTKTLNESATVCAEAEPTMLYQEMGFSPSSYNQNTNASVPSSAASAYPERAIYDIGVEYLFWKGKTLICDLVRNITGVAALGADEPKYVREGRPPPLLNLTLHCEELTSSMGNWITAFYHLRLVAAVGRVDLQFQCSTYMKMAKRSVLPWLSGSYAAPALHQEWPYDFGWPDPPGRVCTQIYAKLPLHHLAHEIQRDMRRIAVAMLGTRHFTVGDELSDGVKSLQELLWRQAPTQPDQSQYPRDDVTLDDAAIHFRCGDVFGGTTKDVYGLIKFQEYVDRIPKDTTKTIGIHTQSFNTSFLREADREQARDCERVTLVLVNFLQEAYPSAVITVRNTKEDIIPLTYARMIMAKQTITTMSTFGIFPTIGSFGNGYYQRSGRQNRFAHRISEVLPNFHAMDGPILSSQKIRESKWEDIIKFLTE